MSKERPLRVQLEGGGLVAIHGDVAAVLDNHGPKAKILAHEPEEVGGILPPYEGQTVAELVKEREEAEASKAKSSSKGKE